MSVSAPNYRHLAGESLKRAKAELASHLPARARYAALELRDCIEALTYDRALAFKDDLPPEEYKSWQPRRLMDVLLEIDPTIGMVSTISFGLENEYGQATPPATMYTLGTEVPISLKDVKQHYNALGSYLHMPSLEQVTTGNIPDIDKLRVRCDALVATVEAILHSPIWNATLGNYATLSECMNEACKKPIKRRLPSGSNLLETRCFECNSEYTVTWGADHQVLWTPKQTLVKCANNDCETTFSLWPHELQPGTQWRCAGCNRMNGIVLTVFLK